MPFYRRSFLLVAAPVALLLQSHALAQSEKPNILVIWGDDIGQSNISAYTHGLMGYQTPSNTYYDWMIDRAFVFVPAQQYVARFLDTFREFPPRQRPASFTIDQVLEKLNTNLGSN